MPSQISCYKRVPAVHKAVSDIHVPTPILAQTMHQSDHAAHVPFGRPRAGVQIQVILAAIPELITVHRCLPDPVSLPVSDSILPGQVRRGTSSYHMVASCLLYTSPSPRD